MERGAVPAGIDSGGAEALPATLDRLLMWHRGDHRLLGAGYQSGRMERSKKGDDPVADLLLLNK